MQKTSSHDPLISTTYYSLLLWATHVVQQEEDFEVWAPKNGDNVCCHWKHMRNTTNNNWELGGNKKGTYETNYWNTKFQNYSKK